MLVALRCSGFDCSVCTKTPLTSTYCFS
uniref:Uncharacterized protein n=1 Tax=Rhizophora mucronata TaxID=61149 RepID=A0A2P2J0P7_RHIMU